MGFEGSAQQCCDGKDDIGNAATIDMQRPDVDTAFVAENAVQCMDGFTSGASDHLLMKRRIAIGDRGVDFHDRITAIVSIEGSEQEECEGYPHQVSGGQLQRAMTAMALCPNPELIVFDEPTTALDVTTQIDVLAAIKHAIKETHTAALYITHDLAVVAQITDDILVLRHGKMVEYGSAKQIIEAPTLTGQAAADRSQGVEGQTEQTLARIDELLAKAGTDKSKILFAQIYLKDAITNFAAMNSVWEQWIPADALPARVTLEAGFAAENILVEMVIQAAIEP